MEPVGASNRQDLFGGDGGGAPPPAGAGDAPPFPVEGAGDGGAEEDDMVELEHVIGFNGSHSNTMVFHPSEPNAYLTSLGATLVLGDLTDPHKQVFLRGHDDEVCAVAVSRTGHLIASGQVGSRRTKAHESPVLVWDHTTRTELYQLDGLTDGVRLLSFSPDERFLAAAGNDSKLYVWDMETGEVMCGRKLQAVCTLVAWGATESDGRRPKYKFSFTHGTQLTVSTLAYDRRSMRYELVDTPCGMPNGGMVREYTMGLSTADAQYVLAGTVAGELVVFNVEANVYRATVPLTGHGVLAMALHPVTGELFVGGGDGMIRKVAGNDMSWAVQNEVKVRGRVVSLSMSPDGVEMLAGTDAGYVYRVLTEDLGVSQYSSSHVRPVSAVAFGSRSDVFATCGADGRVCVWDLSDYSVLAQATHGAAGLCVAFDDPVDSVNVVSGWDDGHVRCHSAAAGAWDQLLWEIPKAHRDGCTAIASSSSCICSGGGDGSVRIWHGRTREFLAQFIEHTGKVTQVLIDNAQNWLVHSCGLDRAIFTYNLKTERRDTTHQMRDGAFTGMTQLAQGDRELITVGTDGRVMFWDCDEREPIDALWDPNREQLNGVQMSPSGRFLAYCGNDCSIKIFDLAEGRLVAVGMGHSDFVKGLRWSPDERQIVSVGVDRCVCVWNFFGMAE